MKASASLLLVNFKKSTVVFFYDLLVAFFKLFVGIYQLVRVVAVTMLRRHRHITLYRVVVLGWFEDNAR